jgi:RimJ/RimL family protein N-acetyltransferase
VSAALDLRRLEEIGLNALQTQRQLFYDGWLLRVSPGRAKRARSVNAYFGSSRPLADKIAYCERIYEAAGLPTLFRMTPFNQPADLEAALAGRGYRAFETTLVQTAPLAVAPEVAPAPDVELSAPDVTAFVSAVATMRRSPPEQQAAHLERLRNTPLRRHGVLASIDGVPVASGQAVLDDGMAGIFDVVTGDRHRRRGLATQVVGRLLAWAWSNGAHAAYLQVDGENAPAHAVYRKFGFVTRYTYHYRAREGECR